MQTTKNTASLRSQHSAASLDGIAPLRWTKAISLQKQNQRRVSQTRQDNPGARIRGTAARYFNACELCAVFARSAWYGISSVPSRLLVTSQAAT